MSLNKGKYKLVGNTNYDSPIESFELFDIDRDPYEIENLIDNKKELAYEMKIEMDNIYNELINSNNIINKPRIIIGSEFENPSFPNLSEMTLLDKEVFGHRTKFLDFGELKCIRENIILDLSLII